MDEIIRLDDARARRQPTAGVDRPGDGERLFFAYEALFNILVDAKSLDEARQMAGEALPGDDLPGPG